MSNVITVDVVYDIVVIGLSETGSGLLRKIASVDGRDRVFGVDGNKKILTQHQAEGFNVGNQIPVANHYIITTPTTANIIEIIKKIPLNTVPLVSIESTGEPGTMKKIYDTLSWLGNFDLFYFPNHPSLKSPGYQYFDTNRIASAFIQRSAVRGVKFYQRYMDTSLIHVFPMEIAEICEPLKNSYRFLENAFAEELEMRCKEKKIDFEVLRNAMNINRDINIKEAGDGIGGKYLPKDTNAISYYFGNLHLLNTAITSDSEYKGLKRRIPKINKWVVIIPLLTFTALVFYLLSNRIFVTFYLNNYIKTFDNFSQQIHQIEKKPSDRKLELMVDSIDKYLDEMRTIKDEIQARKFFSGLLFRN